MMLFVKKAFINQDPLFFYTYIAHPALLKFRINLYVNKKTKL